MSATPSSTLADPQKIIVDLQRQLAECKAERDEVLQREIANSEVLQVINSSPGDLAPVFDTILEKAHSLCGTDLGSLVLYNGEYFNVRAAHGYPEDYAAIIRTPFKAPPNSPFERLLYGEPLVYVADAVEVAAKQSNDPLLLAAIEKVGVRTALYVPLRRDGSLLGYISAQRKEVRPFSNREIALLQSFAAQAVIAIENARLLTETREALEQQTATAEVLQVINASPGDLAPVIETILKKAIRLCGAAFGMMALDQGGQNLTVVFGVPTALAQFSPDSPDGLGRQDRRLRKRWRNCQFFLSPVGSGGIRLLDPA